MAYGAVANLKFVVENHLFETSPWFRPPSLKLLEAAYKELKSFEDFLGGLGGNTRERMAAPLRQITAAIRRFQEELVQSVTEQMFSRDREFYRPENVGKLDRMYLLEVESLKPKFQALFGRMSEFKKGRFGGDAGFGGKRPSNKMVGLSDAYSRIKKDILVGHSAMRRRYVSSDGADVFLIIGMAGIGKTALAEAIFQDLDVLELFEFHVWVSVGRNCRVEEIPLRVLAQLNPDSARKLAEGGGDLGEYIEEILEGKRWLIVLDDVWDARVWSHLDSVLPKEGNGFLPKERYGSRVILTSRSRRVASQAEFIREVRLLNEKESWALLREKLFGGKSCPPEVEEAGKKIAEKCDGLPLTIITVAGLLLKIPKSLWVDVATKRKHQVFVDAYDEISKVLYPSYEDIPQHLKLCFLYMAVFTPNCKVSRSRLINMWSVEGLLESNATKSSEDCGDECLEEFSSNSLIMVYQKRIRSSLLRSTEETKSCGLHSSWWHLCYTEARKYNFLYVLISREDRLEKDVKSQSRLSIHNNILFAIKDVHASMEKNSASTACSLLCLGPYHRYPVPICFGLRFLVNLDALNIRLYEFPLEVLELGGLKYFSLTCDEELPVSISKLPNLQFFIVQQHHNIKSHRAPSFLPVEIWDMKELNHFQIMGSDLPDPPCSTILPNLSTLLNVSGHSCSKGIFERIPHLQKLGIQIDLALDVVEPLRCFDHISQLNELEILKCVVINPAECKFESISQSTSLSIFPLGLKKLTLSGLGYPWKEMSKISSLPCLEVLKLRCNAFRGPRWEAEENGFLKLRVVLIEDADLIHWKVGHGSFKELEHVSVKHCYKLKELHWEFGVGGISKIEVVDCDPSLEYTIRATLLRQRHVPYNFSVKFSWEAEDL